MEKAKKAFDGPEVVVKKLGLVDFSGDENVSPELINDVLDSTSTFYTKLDIAGIAKRIGANKAKYHSARS